MERDTPSFVATGQSFPTNMCVDETITGTVSSWKALQSH